MRTLASISRGSAALILLVLFSHNRLEVRADDGPPTDSGSAISDSAISDIAPVDAEKIAPVDAGKPAGDTDYLAIRDIDDVWLISTRHLGCPSWKSESNFDLECSRYSATGDWVESDLNELLGSDPRLTVIYVHGNRVDYNDAITRAWNAFGVLQADPAAPPMRLIIWSWPSDQIHGAVRDVRSKACRTNTDGQYLGWFLSQMDAETRVSLIGYSFGARVVSGALHVLGGGTLAGQSTRLTHERGDRDPMQVVLIAAAVHNYWLSSGGFHDQFWNFADRLLVLYSTCDPALRRYRFIEKRGRPAALGYTGAWGLEDDHAARTEQLDVCCSVGKTHSENAYFSSTEVIEGVQRHLLYRAAP